MEILKEKAVISEYSFIIYIKVPHLQNYKAKWVFTLQMNIILNEKTKPNQTNMTELNYVNDTWGKKKQPMIDSGFCCFSNIILSETNGIV